MIKRILFSIIALTLFFCGKSLAQEEKTIKYAIDTSTVMSQDAKTIFKLIGFNEKDYGDYTLNEEYTYFSKDGFRAFFKSTHSFSFGISYQLFKTKSDKYLVTFHFGDTDKIDFWFYENGKLIKAKNILPKPRQDKKKFSYSYDVFKSSISRNCYNRDTKTITYETFIWDGEKFVKQK